MGFIKLIIFMSAIVFQVVLELSVYYTVPNQGLAYIVSCLFSSGLFIIIGTNWVTKNH